MTYSSAVCMGITAVAVMLSFASFKKLADARKEIQSLKQQRRSSHEEPKRETCRTAAISEVSVSATFPKTKYPKNGSLSDGDLKVRPIGTVRSVYRLCVGTPRQGLLAPSARGYIQLQKLGDSSTQEAVCGLEGFSHIWVLFIFHLNTQSSSSKRRFKSKITPPALGGKKVGIFATRSPHRANPIGITLCKLDRIQVDSPHQVTLYISGLDLVDGTPVLDIKPFVPFYDSVEGVLGGQSVVVTQPSEESSMARTSFQPYPTSMTPTRVPEWVERGLATFRPVIITNEAEQELENILNDNPKALEFYGSQYQDGEDVQKALTEILNCIQQVLAMDVRSSYQTQKSREGNFRSERSVRIQTRFDTRYNNALVNQYQPKQFCTQLIDNLIIEYEVEARENPQRDTSVQSGAEDIIIVWRIQLLVKR
ncbi:SAM-binding protein [Nitzschia inconspicua]|uniref:SAM-binding protein n=1 Tax=Nitzschia inconspicua TaxID=303405 RepID=A0A9K3M1G7_9STRA|nr:SAM-binding protein [Nitzschia inconspicua]